MKKYLLSLPVVLILLSLVVGIGLAARIGVTDPGALRDLAKVRQATQQYHDVDKALADGYLPSTECVADPQAGTMGFHYVNPQRAMDPAIDLTAPEILLYAPVNGKLKLVGVEYFIGIGAPDAPVPNPAPPAPILFGIPFDGPMLGHEPGMPPHYDLHVWLWQANPSGMFAPFNPKINCQ